MKLSYFELLSPSPIYIQQVGGIISPKLSDIDKIGINTYQYYLTILLMDLKTYFSLIHQSEQFELLSDEEKSQMNIFDLFISDKNSAELLQNALNFFIKEDVVFSPEYNCFLVNKNTSIEEKERFKEEITTVGIITKEIYPELCDLICQRVNVKSNKEEDLSKIKSKKALEIMKKIQKGRAEKAKQTKSDKNMELGNIISAVANHHQSLNIINIWDLTVYQLWDSFARLSNNDIYNIQSISVATWGDKDNHFDATGWFRRIDTIN